MSENIPNLDDKRRQQRLDALASGAYRPPTAVSCLSGVFLILTVVLIVGVLAGWLSHPAWIFVLFAFAIIAIFYARFLIRMQHAHKAQPTKDSSNTLGS